MTELTYGPQAVETATALINLGTAWLRLGQPGKGRELLERALRILRAHHPNGRHQDFDSFTRILRAVAPDVVVLDDGQIVDLHRDHEVISDGAPRSRGEQPRP